MKTETVSGRTRGKAGGGAAAYTKGELQLQTVFLCVLLCLALFQAGGFHTYVSAELNILLVLMLAWTVFRRKFLLAEKSLFFLGLVLVCAFHFLVYFYAVDPSMSLKGGVKFLPAVLFWLYLMQTDGQAGRKAASFLPFSARRP